MSFLKDTVKVSPIQSAQDGWQDKTLLRLDAMDARPDVEAVTARLSDSPSGLVGEGEGATSTAATPDEIRSSPPALINENDVAMDLDPPSGIPEDIGVKSDSDTETIILPGKDGDSPSKIRKSIKYEDKSDDEEMLDSPDIGGSRKNGVSDEIKEALVGKADGGKQSEATSTLGKRKRSKHANGNTTSKDDLSHHGNSSGLSSVPTSPVATTRSSLSKPAVSDSDNSRSPSPHARSAVRAKAKSVDRVLPRRKQYASGSGDEGEAPRFSRQRSSGVDQKQSKEHRVSTKIVEASSRKHTRSISPPPRGHRRSISTQLPSKSTQGLSHKKKRVPAPLQSTEYQSDESSASASSHPRSSRLRHLAPPTAGDSAVSPAKLAGPHKKHVNSSGQTLVARACQSGKLEVVKQRLEERPEDLDEVDFAENTPLHTASIAGFEDIVQYLLEAGCSVDPVNVARDTPLHDAIDNGHLDVVKLLLDAGANPRKANGKGEDPYDLVDDDCEVADEIREAILAAKNKTNDRRSSEDEQMHENADSRLSHPRGSPRQSPSMQANESAPLGSRRNATTRSVKTSDRVLYQPLNVPELRKAAGQNDTNMVVRILDVHNNKIDDAKSLIIAAKAGHQDVINLLFGYGQFNPDPEPIDSQGAESATPILAAIGRENLEVIELFLNQPNFDPTRRVNGETYYEIAKRRAGSVWKEEEALLKDAFDKYKKVNKSSSGKPRSPGLRRDARDDRDGKRAVRKDDQQSPRSHKRSTSSPKMKESELGKSLQQSNSSISQLKEGQNNSKKGPGRPRRDESSSTAISDRETTPLGPPKQKSQAKRSESDVVPSSENETAAKPRRKLVSGKEFRGERELEKQRRPSIASTTSSTSVRDKRESESKSEKTSRKTSPSISRISSKASNIQESDLMSEKQQDKGRSLKRDESKDRLSAIRGESPGKRPRKSETPPRSGMHEVATGYDNGGPQKRRKLESDSKSGSKADSTPSSSPEHRISTKNNSSHEKSMTNPGSDTKEKDKGARSSQKRIDSPERKKNRNASNETEFSKNDKSISEKSTKHDLAENGAALALKAEEEHEAQRLLEKEEKEAQIRREKEERETREKAELEEKMEKERIEEAKQARLAREQVAREEEIKRQQEENERKERQRREDAAAHAREQERQKALYLEQEKQRKEEQDRRRAQIQEQQRADRIRIEKEKRIERLAKLPLLLRWLDMEADPRTPQNAALFRFIEGFRYDTIRPEATGLPTGREQWMLNTQVALLLGEKDLQLSRYTAWERIPLSQDAKKAIWKIENGMYSLRHPNLTALRKQFDEGEPAYKVIEKCKQLFLELDLFFVKVSEFMFVVPNFPHLRGLEMVVKYRELEEVAVWPRPGGKWRQDPDVDPSQQFIPQPNYFVNGEFIRQGEVLRTKTSTTSLGERRVPRRGLIQVFPDDPEYLSLAKEQGLYWLLPENQSRHNSGGSLPDHVQTNGQANGQINGITPPSSDKSKSVNGGSPSRGSLSEPARPSPRLPNGTHKPNDTLMELNT